MAAPVSVEILYVNEPAAAGSGKKGQYSINSAVLYVRTEVNGGAKQRKIISRKIAGADCRGFNSSFRIDWRDPAMVFE